MIGQDDRSRCLPPPNAHAVEQDGPVLGEPECHHVAEPCEPVRLQRWLANVARHLDGVVDMRPTAPRAAASIARGQEVGRTVMVHGEHHARIAEWRFALPPRPTLSMQQPNR